MRKQLKGSQVLQGPVNEQKAYTLQAFEKRDSKCVKRIQTPSGRKHIPAGQGGVQPEDLRSATTEQQSSG
jgi:hypothetical protein